ncbi:response regulator [Flavobacterium muglaense]|uniref:Response regulator transcription factor n=1 Tax=Flavobacterium muglaense TaxID=2764716 RepID=A0A923SEZ1_9FLAO|nr:response regulator transcription factor [Flavobacterium muglaense]MBC5837537.1 response regulator transcription factor [Flavobacterium muglaense]MBC5844046.1 response regulator transcription factor [Flavobacterium muglaense]
MAIRIFIYDDSDERRDSLKALLMLNDDFKFVGEAMNCKNVLFEIETYYPDVVLMDINMPEVDGIEGLRQIKTHHPEVKVLMQTAFDDSEKIFTCIKNGASGYILKNDKPQRILQAIEEVNQGGAAMNPAIAQKVLDFFIPKQIENPLSPKETQVLSLLADGLSYKMVADKLGVSYSTVNTHAKRIYEKLHISSLGEAIAFYYKNLKP